MLSYRLKDVLPVFALTVLTLSIALPSTSYASGSFSPSSNNGSQQAYNLGKKVFHKKLACKKCVLPKKKLSKEEAQHLINNLEVREEFTSILSPKESEATKVYLVKRYKLQ